MNFNDQDPNYKVEQNIAKIKAADKIYTIEKERKKIDDRARYTNLTRRLHQQRIQEDYYDKNITRAQLDHHYQEKVQADLALAYDIDRQRDEELKTIKMRQLIRANIPELRDLESKLRTAYVTKELKTQLAEKEYFKMFEKQKRKEADEIVAQALVANLAAEQKEREENRKRQLQYKKDLQDQMILNHQLKENVYEEFLKEKKYIDYIIQRIYDEDQRQKEDKMCKMKRTQDEITAFKKAQEIWKLKQRQELEEENTRMETYLRDKAVEEKARKLEKTLIKDERTKLIDHLGRKIFEEDKQREAREAFVQDLHEEELKQMNIEKVEREIKLQIQRRIEMYDVLAVQVEERKQRENQEKLEDIQYKEQLWAKMAEENKLNQLSAERKRRKKIEIRHEVEDAMNERRAKRAEEIKRLIYLSEQEKITEEKKRQIIEEERIRMLKEHAINLIGYLPPGVLRADDIQHLGSDIVKPKPVDC